MNTYIKSIHAKREKLEDVLITNKNKLSISCNGFISLNMNSAETKKSIAKQLNILNNFKVTPKLI